MGVRVDPARDTIRVDGERIPGFPRNHTYLLLNKPRGFVTTLADPRGRPTVLDLLRGVERRVFPVGRLDFNSEGLLLLTDDGELARTLMHPASEVEKTYAVKVRGTPGRDSLQRLRSGVRLGCDRARPARVTLTKPGPNSWLEVTVTEGRKHQVRRMLRAVGHPVVKLRRVRYAGVRLGDLRPGAVRRLSRSEVELLRRAARGGERGGAAGSGPS
jgi:23S rRNA pseudouridine2605 synthase